MTRAATEVAAVYLGVDAPRGSHGRLARGVVAEVVAVVWEWLVGAAGHMHLVFTRRLRVCVDVILRHLCLLDTRVQLTSVHASHADALWDILQFGFDDSALIQ